MRTPTCSVILLTRNEAANLPKALLALDWADEVIVLDDQSSDGTPALAKALGARVHRRALDNFAHQRNAALALAASNWAFFVDADEVIPTRLANEIQDLIRTPLRPEVAYFVQRANYLCGAPIRYAWGQDALIRLVRPDAGRFESGVHEKFVPQGPVGYLSAPLIHYNSTTLAEYQAKNRQYARLEAEQRIADGRPSSLAQLYLSPLQVFVHRYLRLQGFRDGAAGLTIAKTLAAARYQVHREVREHAQQEAAPQTSRRIR